jgi:hypoxanthine-DNA glycosylase
MKTPQKKSLSCDVGVGRKSSPSSSLSWPSVASMLLCGQNSCAGLSHPSSSSLSQNMQPPKRSNGISTTKQTRAVFSDGKAILQSFDPLEDPTKPEQVHTLILGTMPSEKSFGNNLSERDILLRGGDGQQNYGHPRNSFWNIVGSAFGFCRHQLPYREQVKTLVGHGYAVWDVLHEAQRKGSLDCDLVKGSLRPTDIPRFIMEHPNLTRLVFAANSAEVFCKPDVWAGWLDTGSASTLTSSNPAERNAGTTTNTTISVRFWIQDQDSNPDTFGRTNKIFGRKRGVSVGPPPSGEWDASSDDDAVAPPRNMELIVMPSTSPANANNRPPEKEKTWHRAAYRMSEPPDTYICPGCHGTSTNKVVVATESPYFASSSSRKRRNGAAIHDVAVESVKDHQNSESRFAGGADRHWFHDCPYREDWKAAKRNTTKKRKGKSLGEIRPIEVVTAEFIDPFEWYM